MHIHKIWQSLSELDLYYKHLMNDVMNDFSQEIIDGEGFYNNGSSNMSPDQSIASLQNTLDDKKGQAFENSALEFCLTNEYITARRSWNCITHLLTHHKNLFSKKNIQYLKALNNSYASVYQVVDVVPNQSIHLQNMIETDQPSVEIANTTISKTLKKKNFVSTRVLALQTKANITSYQISNTLLHLPDDIAQSSINVINIMKQTMNTSLIRTNPTLDTPHNQLLQKKLWVKEILEQWYIYHRDNSSHQDKKLVFH